MVLWCNTYAVNVLVLVLVLVLEATVLQTSLHISNVFLPAKCSFNVLCIMYMRVVLSLYAGVLV